MEQVVYELDEVGGHEFEAVVMEILRRRGFAVERGKLTNDEGRDLILRRGAETVVVECKHQRAPVGRPVVQKLHSATMTFPGASRGLLVTSSRFSEAARSYALDVNTRPGVVIDLWDHDDLVQEARSVGVFLVQASEGTSLFFELRARGDRDLEEALYRRHFKGVRSKPRTVEDVVDIDENRVDLVPVIAVEYRVDQKFETSVGLLYHALEVGRVLFPVRGDISPAERAFWSGGRVRLIERSAEDRAVAAKLFGASMSGYRERVARDVAARLSKTVTYTGGNNQTYTKSCEVLPQQVETTSQQILFSRRTLSFSLGPSRYRVTLADDAGRDWLVSSTEGFRKGDAGFLRGDGVICNDCGALSPASGRNRGRDCVGCGRTLCREHTWGWPSAAPVSARPSLCSACYRAREPKHDHLEPHLIAMRAPWKAALLGIAPGLPFLLERRWVPGGGLIGAALGLVGLSIAGVVDAGAAATLVPSVGAAASVAWSVRVRDHQRNAIRLRTYVPPWS